MLDLKIRNYALQNAVRFNGTASSGAVIGKILAEKPELKPKVSEIKEKVNKAIEEVNKLNPEEQRSLLEKDAPELLKEKKHKEKERALPELKNAKNLVMRFEPSPSGPLHIGHAYVLSLNSEYCRKYKGKLILRIGDTNPEKIYKPAYKLIEEDARWVTRGNISQVIIQSSRMERYYSYMEKLIGMAQAYICTCNPEKYKKLINGKKACPCRSLSKEEQANRWKMMFKGYKQGEAVARVKTDIQDKNPAMRDFPVFRINDSEHPRQGKKYRVWPLMNMAVAVDDMESKVTHVIRAKDHHDNAMRQRYIYDYLDRRFPEAIFVGRINFKGMPVSCSKTRPLIENKTYGGWDDIRLPFLAALKRRGYTPEALARYSIDVGISLNDKTVTKDEFFKTINSFNKDVIDKKARRYFFIKDPKEITIKNSPSQDIELDLHPESIKGGRKFKTKDTFYVSEEDLKGFQENLVYRLMDCLNFIKEENSFIFHSLEYRKYKEKGKSIIHWLPKEKGLIKIEVIMPDNKIIKGLGEKSMKKIDEGQVIQAERFGFLRCDKKERGLLRFWFAHK
ncbi:glutamate--tRNA ligase [Candidatus Woesearchaeota archaeon]|nr:glutamate--tRNA ligase [Candidatus Woesearchaeota archaeon]